MMHKLGYDIRLIMTTFCLFLIKKVILKILYVFSNKKNSLF